MSECHRWTRKGKHGPLHCEKCGVSHNAAIHFNWSCPGEIHMDDEPKVMYTVKRFNGPYEGARDPAAAVKWDTPSKVPTKTAIYEGDKIVRLIREDAPGEWEEVPEEVEPEEGAEVAWVMKYLDGGGGYWPSELSEAHSTPGKLMERWTYYVWRMGRNSPASGPLRPFIEPVRIQRRTEPRWRDDGEVR